MEALIDPIDCNIMEKELKYAKLLRVSRLRNNEIYML